MIEELFLNYRGFLQHGIIFGLTIWAFLRGEVPEKLAGSILSAMVAALYVFAWVDAPMDDHGGVIMSYFVIDLGAFLALVPLAMRANRMYPIWLLAAQLISLAMQFQRELLPSIDPIAYYVLIRGPSWVQVLALAIGLYLHRRRLRRFGPYRSWRTRSRRS